MSRRAPADSDGQPVGIAARAARQASRQGGRLRGRQFGDEDADDTLEFLLVGLATPPAGNHDGEFAPITTGVGRNGGADVGERAAITRLVELGQLASDERRACLAERGGEIIECLGDAVDGLVENKGIG